MGDKIAADAGLFDADLMTREYGPEIGKKWEHDRLRDRLDQIIAHEHTEAMGISHEEAVQCAAETPLAIREKARERLRAIAYETIKLARTLTPEDAKETTIRYMNDSLKFTGRFDKNAAFDVHISTILINNDIVIATFPGEPFIQLQLDWKNKVEVAHPFLFGYTWYHGTWPNYVPDIKSAALGGYGADQSNPKMIEVGSGEAMMNKHLENMYRLTGSTSPGTGPCEIQAGCWLVTPVPRDK